MKIWANEMLEAAKPSSFLFKSWSTNDALFFTIQACSQSMFANKIQKFYLRRCFTREFFLRLATQRWRDKLRMKLRATPSLSNLSSNEKLHCELQEKLNNILLLPVSRTTISLEFAFSIPCQFLPRSPALIWTTLKALSLSLQKVMWASDSPEQWATCMAMLSSVLHCKLQEKLPCVTAPLVALLYWKSENDSMFSLYTS